MKGKEEVEEGQEWKGCGCNWCERLGLEGNARVY